MLENSELQELPASSPKSSITIFVETQCRLRTDRNITSKQFATSIVCNNSNLTLCPKEHFIAKELIYDSILAIFFSEAGFPLGEKKCISFSSRLAFSKC